MAELNDTVVSASGLNVSVQVLFVPIDSVTIGLAALIIASSDAREPGTRAFNAFLRINLMRMKLFEVPLRIVSVLLEGLWWEEKQRSCCRDRIMMGHALCRYIVTRRCC